jgi:Luciferase
MSTVWSEPMNNEQMRGAERITATVSSWPGVEVGPHRFGGVEFRVGRRELGHLHGDRIADLPFPRRVWDELIAEGRARRHHVLPESGWVTVSIDEPDGIDAVIDLFRFSYDRARSARRSPRSTAARTGSQT